LIKLDIEGFEIEALRGATRILERRPKLAIEVHVDMLRRYGRRADEILDWVSPRDYELWLQRGADHPPRPYAGEKLNAQHMDQVPLYARRRGGSGGGGGNGGAGCGPGARRSRPRQSPA